MKVCALSSKMAMFKAIIKCVVSVVLFVGASQTVLAGCHDLLNYQATKLRSSKTIDFCEHYKDKALLLVNTASQCGFTPQFKGLQALHEEYGDKLAVIGFPSDDFNQEHRDTQKVADVCYVNYGVTFTMLEPSKVTGDGANALFKALAHRTGKQPAWNFNKYLVSVDGETVQYFASSVEPNSIKLKSSIDALIK